MTDLLFEIGTEEIPAGYITPALNQIKTLFGERFKYFRLTFQSIYCTGTPRRLVVFIKGLPEEQESVTEEIQGPSVAIAFDKAGNLTKAGLGFAKSQGIESNTLQTKKNRKGRILYCNKTDYGGKDAASIAWHSGRNYSKNILPEINEMENQQPFFRQADTLPPCIIRQ